jgi:hypothetical protein
MKKLNCKAIIILSLIASAVMGYEFNPSIDDFSDVVKANVAALSDDEPGSNGVNTAYLRNDSDCVFHVGAGVSINVFGIGVLTAGPDGNLSIPGKVICMAGGNMTCKPVECIDIYAVLFK